MVRTIRLLGLLAITGAFVMASSLAPKEITVEGVIIDSKCFGMNNDNVANEHVVPAADGTMGKIPYCATACANMGIPAAVLEGGKKDGKVYVLITPAPQMADHMAKKTKVTGELAYKGAIIPTKVQVQNEAGKWEEVSLATMM